MSIPEVFTFGPLTTWVRTRAMVAVEQAPWKVKRACRRANSGVPQRVHGAFVDDPEVHRVVEHLKSLGPPNYIEGLLEGGTSEDGEGSDSGEAPDAEKDPMYDQAVDIVLKNKRASISLVQRHLRIGYNRSARLLEAMEKAGLVSAMQGNGNRDILVRKAED